MNNKDLAELAEFAGLKAVIYVSEGGYYCSSQMYCDTRVWDVRVCRVAAWNPVKHPEQWFMVLEALVKKWKKQYRNDPWDCIAGIVFYEDGKVGCGSKKGTDWAISKTFPQAIIDAAMEVIRKDGER